MPLPRLLSLTLLTLIAFAANSVLCRLALFEERMDPALFTLLRTAAQSARRLPDPPHDYQHVALLDDVVTTGATAGHLTRLLHESGVT
ncbi:hypothetical protein ACTFBY_19280, partial [Aeromonas dhakensis]